VALGLDANRRGARSLKRYSGILVRVLRIVVNQSLAGDRMGAAPEPKAAKEDMTEPKYPDSASPLAADSQTGTGDRIVEVSPTRERLTSGDSNLRITTGMIVAFCCAIMGYLLSGSLGVLLGIIIGGSARLTYLSIAYHRHRNQTVN
jgi:hypothetical protein